MLHDLRHSLRTIGRAKGTTAVLLISLALGTGVNAAVHGVLDALLLGGPAGVADPARLVSIFTSEFSGAVHGPSSYPDYLSVKSTAASFAAIAAVDDNTIENVVVGHYQQSARIAAVSEQFFAALQMRAHAGRLLTPGDELLDPAAAVAVISHRLAQQLDPAAQGVGETLAIADRRYSIVGVTPPHFQGLQAGRESDVWILLAPAAARGDRRLSIVARLTANATLRSAADELRAISDKLAAQHPNTNRGRLTDAGAPRRITPVWYSQLDATAGTQILVIGIVVGGAAALLLASACLNVGSLLMSRAVARRHEFAIKMALGATRAMLIRQSIAETMWVSLAGGLLGLLFAFWTSGAIPALFMAEQAELLDTRLDAGAILLTVGVAFVAGTLFAIAPAFQGTNAPAVTALRADSGGVSMTQGGGRLRGLLVAAQVALSTVLLLGTGLLVMSLSQALEGGLASAARSVAYVAVKLPGSWADPISGIAFRTTLLDRLAKVGGVDSVGWATVLPLESGVRRRLRIEAATANVTDSVELTTNVVSTGYFRVMALPCIEGRLFDDTDGVRAPPVVVVDELLAQRYFGAAAVGRYLVDTDGVRAQIVGVVRSGRYRTLQQSPQPTVYYSSRQEYLPRGHVVVRTSHDPATLLGAIDGALKEVGRGEAIPPAATLESHLLASLGLDRLTTTLVGLCGLIALAMSTIGVYGVMTDTVQRRTREIGLRVALGAGRFQVAGLVFGDAVSLAGLGLVTGAAAALAIGRAGQTFVHGLPSLDIATLAAAPGALIAVIVVAALVPLRRALGVSANVALRAE